MLYREIIAVCSEIHTKYINIVCGQNVELWMLNLVVNTVTTGLGKVNVFWWWYLALFVPHFLVACLSSRAKERRAFWGLDVSPCFGDWMCLRVLVERGEITPSVLGLFTHSRFPLIRNMGSWRMRVFSLTSRPLHPLIWTGDTSKRRDSVCCREVNHKPSVVQSVAWSLCAVCAEHSNTSFSVLWDTELICWGFLGWGLLHGGRVGRPSSQVGPTHNAAR